MVRKAGRRAAPWACLVLTLAYTWTFLGVAYLIGGNWLSFPTVVFVVIGLLGPAVVATALVWSGRSQETVRAFWKRVFGRGLSLRWYGVIGVLAVSPFLAARLIQEGTSAGVVAGAPPLAFAAISVFAGIIEEPGWRGYALDSLIRRRSVLLMSLVVGCSGPRGIFHLFFIEGSYHQGLGFATTAF